MVKVLKFFNRREQVQTLLESRVQNRHYARLIKIVALSIFLHHLIACFWFLGASLQQNVWGTWVGQRNIVDNTQFNQYLNSFYWALQTTTTIGYGDFTLTSTGEFIFASLWMVVGTTVFTFVIGNITNMMTEFEAQNHLISNRILTVSLVSKKFKLSFQTTAKMKNYFLFK